MGCKLGQFVRVLFVDDDPQYRQVYWQIFRKDFEMDFAESAGEAVRLIETKAFQAVISDYFMPVHTGLWLMEILQSRHPKILRILTSGGNVPDLQKHIRSGLVQHFFPKPLSQDSLLDYMKKAGLSAS